MASYKDFIFTVGDYGKLTEVTTESNVIVLAIKNILLSRPGNFPSYPSLGINIKKYKFELLDDQEISNLKTELSEQISAYIPNLNSVNLSVEKLERDNKYYLGITLSAFSDGESITSNFLVATEDTLVTVYNETH